MRCPTVLIALVLLAGVAGAEPPPGCADCADLAVIEEAGLLYATTGTSAQVDLAGRINLLIEGGAGTLVGFDGATEGLAPVDAWRVAHQMGYATTALAGFYQAKPRAAGLEAALDLIGLERTVQAPAQLAGDWQCRKLRVDGAAAVVTTFRWFTCRIAAAGEELRLDKIDGSERIGGDVVWAGDGGILAGCEVKGAGTCRYDGEAASRRAGVLAFDSANHGALLRIGGLRMLEILEFRR